MLSLKPRPFVQSFFDMQAPRQPHVFLLFLFCFFGVVAFFEYFRTNAVFSLYGEYVVPTLVRFFLPDGVFLSCDHRLDFFASALFMEKFNQSVNQKHDDKGRRARVHTVL